MRTLAVTQNITLDGAVEMLDDWFDPQAAPMTTTRPPPRTSCPPRATPSCSAGERSRISVATGPGRPTTGPA